MSSTLTAMATRLPFVLMLIISNVIASPISNHRLVTRSSKGRKVGVNFAIAISIVIFAAIVFYLGMRRGRSGSWFCWRDPSSSLPSANPSSLDVSKPLPPRPRSIPRTNVINENEIAEPIELSPVEAKPKFLELPGETGVFEIGEGRKSWFNGFDIRRSWFGGSNGERRSWWRSEKGSIYEMEGSSVPPMPPLPPPPSYQPANERRNEAGTPKEDEKSIDWAGMDYVKEMYAGKGSVRRPNSESEV
ncbi:hypothetical protein BDV96DRAFT_646417 [Lophiotrema nucula]|uniref:Transmembrane protein n=1 Tax=Lophiotrema nucula TaxID=690887 RepID=A0A6A5ZAJ4_9PLEO|nr:hypothetical protein BDV96DRAFT_646417 [Lophiotrema nucula]